MDLIVGFRGIAAGVLENYWDVSLDRSKEEVQSIVRGSYCQYHLDVPAQIRSCPILGHRQRSRYPLLYCVD